MANIFWQFPNRTLWTIKYPIRISSYLMYKYQWFGPSSREALHGKALPPPLTPSVYHFWLKRFPFMYLLLKSTLSLWVPAVPKSLHPWLSLHHWESWLYLCSNLILRSHSVLCLSPLAAGDLGTRLPITTNHFESSEVEATSRKTRPGLLTPLDKFRGGLGYVSVSDLTAQFWCEQQMEYNFLAPEPKPETVQMQLGKDIHMARGKLVNKFNFLKLFITWIWVHIIHF